MNFVSFDDIRHSIIRTKSPRPQVKREQTSTSTTRDYDEIWVSSLLPHDENDVIKLLKMAETLLQHVFSGDRMQAFIDAIFAIMATMLVRK